ncbi:MAG: thermonuclease family protein [Theionarchaea archaeon]|nr:thermonuclease family protein [Theionarchaea archaeon]
MPMHNRSSLFVVLIVVVVNTCIQQPQALSCVAVLDGDTIELNNGESVRLIGIDAPGLFEPGGDIARDYLSCLVLGKKVVLVTQGEDRDAYDRLLRYVYVDSMCVNEEMVKNGYSEVRYLSKDDPNREYYIQLEIEAETKKAGLWRLGVFQPRVDLKWEGGIPVISWREADQYYGCYVIVEGLIMDTYNSGEVCFLNFDPEWQQYFTAVIFACDFPDFPESPEKYYLGRKVQIIGFIREYRGKPEIIVKTPDQIKILE